MDIPGKVAKSDNPRAKDARDVMRRARSSGAAGHVVSEARVERPRGSGKRFDATRGYPGEGPEAMVFEPCLDAVDQSCVRETHFHRKRGKPLDQAARRVAEKSKALNGSKPPSYELCKEPWHECALPEHYHDVKVAAGAVGGTTAVAMVNALSGVPDENQSPGSLVPCGLIGGGALGTVGVAAGVVSEDGVKVVGVVAARSDSPVPPLPSTPSSDGDDFKDYDKYGVHSEYASKQISEYRSLPLSIGYSESFARYAGSIPGMLMFVDTCSDAYSTDVSQSPVDSPVNTPATVSAEGSIVKDLCEPLDQATNRVVESNGETALTVLDCAVSPAMLTAVVKVYSTLSPTDTPSLRTRVGRWWLRHLPLVRQVVAGTVNEYAAAGFTMRETQHVTESNAVGFTFPLSRKKVRYVKRANTSFTGVASDMCSYREVEVFVDLLARLQEKEAGVFNRLYVDAVGKPLAVSLQAVRQAAAAMDEYTLWIRRREILNDTILHYVQQKIVEARLMNLGVGECSKALPFQC